MLSLENTTTIPLNWKLRQPHGHFGLRMSLNQQEKKGMTVLARVIDPDYQGEIVLFFYNGCTEEYVWNTGDPAGYHLV